MLLVLIGLLSMAYANAQSSVSWKTFTWDSYKTKFEVPYNFEVYESTGEVWKGGNNDITLNIFPRTDEKLSVSGMERALINWAEQNQVIELTEVTELNPDVMNGYWGVLLEGTKNSWPIGLMLLIDPDYPDISMYIWVSYESSQVNVVLEMLKSFKPS